VLEWILRWVLQNGINHVVLGVAYKKDQIIKYFRNGRDFGLDISYSQHTVAGGTGEGFRLAISRFVSDKRFLAMNCDELSDLDVSKLARSHQSDRDIATIAVSPLRSPFGVVQLRGTRITGFREKPVIRDHFVSIGIYLLESQIMTYLPEKGDIERVTFPILARERRLSAYLHNGFWTTMNTIKDVRYAEEYIKRRT